MQTKLPNNFPPCPMCRAPITRAIKDIDLMEPARAEEDIIEFVRPYENCDFCQRRERPTLRCLECSGLICGTCQPVHGKLQSHHTVLSIFELDVVVQQPVTKAECKTHPNQTLDLYCLMCNTMLCLYCEKYTHSSCTNAYATFTNYKQKLRNSSQLVQDFVYSCDERKTLMRTLETNVQLYMRAEQTAHLHRLLQTDNIQRSFALLQTPASTKFRTTSQADQAVARIQNLHSLRDFDINSISVPATLRVVHVNEFAAFARNFICDLTEEVEKDVGFFEEYVGRLENIVGSKTDSSVLIERKENLKTGVKQFIEMGKMVSENNKSMDRLNDVEVAEFALSKEITSLQFFRFRKPYSMDVRCIELTLNKVKDTKSIIRQRSLCTMHELTTNGANCLFVDRIEVYENLLQDKHLSNEIAETKTPQPTNDTDTHVTSDRNISPENKTVLNTIKCLSVRNRDGYSQSYNNRDDSLYENSFSENARRLQLLIKGGLVIDVKTIYEAGFTGNDFAKAIENKCLERCKYSKKRSFVNIVTSAVPSVLKYQTYLVNVFFAAPFEYKSNSMITRMGDLKKDQLSPIICLIGSRGIDFGVEALFLASDDGIESVFTNGVAVRAKIARFNQTDFSCTRGTSVSETAVYRDKNGLYCLLKGMSYSGRSLVTYFTNVGESCNETVYHIPKDGPEAPISISCIKAELLCEMKGGVFYASRDEETGAIVIGRLKMTGVLTKATIFTVTETDATAKINKLRPLTMAESRHGTLIIVCAVDDDASKLVLIVPMKETVEILEIQYPDSEYDEGEVVDLEMDSDGNIVCILKDVNGRMWRVITKYIMP